VTANATALEIVRLDLAHVDALAAMLGALRSEGLDKWFEPHPFDREHLVSLCDAGKRDLFYVMTAGEDVAGYGLLRGWDEGYEVPSLGIAIHLDYRGKKLGRAMMEFLHAAAAMRGSKQVRLRVYPDNEFAIALYRRTGYRFDTAEGDQSDQPIVGVKHL
jgi:ribosomal protein S18 acetylase RimI-like enzyme